MTAGVFHMSRTVAIILIVVVPLLLSLAWFAFWVVKVMRAGREARSRPRE
jgi:hypothetical protein